MKLASVCTQIINLLLICFALTYSVNCAASDSPEVLIYYANETVREWHSDENYVRIMNLLRNSGIERLRSVAESYDNDVREFPDVVQAEVSTIVQRMRNMGGSAFIIDNELASHGHAMVVQRGESITIDIPRQTTIEASSQAQKLRHNPLASPETIKRVLTAAKTIFGSDHVKFVLITKSHGSDVYALMPRLYVDVTSVSDGDIVELAESNPSTEKLPDWARPVGITKSDYLQTIQDMGAEQGMQFSLVFLEACKSVIAGEFGLLPANVQTFAHSGMHKLEYKTINYPEIFSQLGNGTTISNAILSQLSSVDGIVIIDRQQDSLLIRLWRWKFTAGALIILAVWLSIWRFTTRFMAHR